MVVNNHHNPKIREAEMFLDELLSRTSSSGDDQKLRVSRFYRDLIVDLIARSTSSLAMRFIVIHRETDIVLLSSSQRETQ